MEMMMEAFADAAMDCVRMLPFLFVAFLLIEGVEHASGSRISTLLSKRERGGVLAGAVLGCIPQCGFSVLAANLYSGGMITIGTLLAVFLATSDEAILILLGKPSFAGAIGGLIGCKLLIGILAGYLLDVLYGKERRKSTDRIHELCEHEGCGCEKAEGVVRPALLHTVRIFLYLLVFTFVLNLVLAGFGAERLSAFLLHGTVFQPFLTGLVGLIPNCASSILLTELYMAGSISFGAVIAGLCSGAGIGLVVLFKVNRDWKENLRIVLILYGISVLAGLILQLL